MAPPSLHARSSWVSALVSPKPQEKALSSSAHPMSLHHSLTALWEVSDGLDGRWSKKEGRGWAGWAVNSTNKTSWNMSWVLCPALPPFPTPRPRRALRQGLLDAVNQLTKNKVFPPISSSSSHSQINQPWIPAVGASMSPPSPGTSLPQLPAWLWDAEPPLVPLLSPFLAGSPWITGLLFWVILELLLHCRPRCEHHWPACFQFAHHVNAV